MKTVSLHSDSLTSPWAAREDGISSGLSLGLVALTLPTVGYTLAQLSHLLSGGNLEQAIRAFVP